MKGGARKGSGRKPMAIEEDVRGAIKRALDAQPGALDEVWANVIKNARQGNEKHQKILLEYYYGKPKENEGNPTEMIITIVEE